MIAIPRPLPLSVSACVLAALASTVRAQSFSVSPSQISIADATGHATWVFGRAVAAELNGDFVNDVVVLDGCQATLLVDPSVYDAQIALPHAVNDVDVLRPLTGAGRGSILSVGSTGLEQTQLVSGTPASFTSTVIASSSDWLGAVLVRAGDIDGNGSPDIVGVDAARTKILTRVWNGSAHVAGPTINTYGIVDEIVLYDRDGDGVKEIGCRTSLGFEAYNLAGQLVQGIVGYQRGDAIARVRAAGQSRDDVAWISKGPSGSAQYLALIRPWGLSSLVALGSLGTGALVAGDVDNDGYDDLVLNQTAANALVVLFNIYDPANPPDSNANLFQASGPARFDLPQLPTGSPASSSAWPLLFDCDNDGDLDLAQAIEGSHELFLHKSRVIDHLAKRPTISQSAAEWDPETSVASYQALMPVSPASDATTLVVRVWRKDSTSPYTTPVVEDAHEYTLDGSSSYAVTLQLAVPSQLDEIHFIEQRLVKKVGGVLQAAYPASIYGLYHVASESAPVFLNGLVGATTSSVSFGHGIYPDRVEIGSIVPEEEVPDFEKGKEPQPNPNP